MQHPNRWFVAPVISSLLVAAALATAAAAPAAAVAPAAPAAPACTVEQITDTEGAGTPDVDVDADGDRLLVTSAQPLDGGNIGGNVEAWLWSPDLRSGENPLGFRQLTETQNGTAADPALSDGGQVVAFSSTANLVPGANTDGNREVFSWNLGGGSLVQRTATIGGTTGGVDLAGDGETLTWHSDRDLLGANEDLWPEVYRLDIVTPLAAPQQQTFGLAGFSTIEPALDADGDTWSFSSNLNLGGLNPDQTPDAWVQTPNGTTAVTRSTVAGSFEDETTISGNGTTVAVADARNLTGGNEGGNHELYVLDSRLGGTAVQLTDEEAGDSTDPSLDGTGQRVAFASTSRITDDEPFGEITQDLFVLDRTTGRATQLTEPGVPATYADQAAASADSTRIAFVSDLRTVRNQDGNREVFLATCGAPNRTFTDVPTGHTFFNEIGWMAAADLSQGYQPGPTYRPGAPVTRAAMSAFLYRLADLRTPFVPPATPTFADVGLQHPFRAEVEWMAAGAITGGYPDGTFRPGAPVSRGAMSAFLFRFAGELGGTLPPAPHFTDVGLQHPFIIQIEWMAEQGISTGYQPGPHFRPADPVTRQAMSAFLQRFHAAFPDAGAP